MLTTLANTANTTKTNLRPELAGCGKHYTAFARVAIQCFSIEVSFNFMYCIALHVFDKTVLQCIVLHVLHCIALYCISDQ